MINTYPVAGDSARRHLTSWAFNSKVCSAMERRIGIKPGDFQEWLFDVKRDSFDLVWTADLLLHSDAVVAAMVGALMEAGQNVVDASRSVAVSRILMSNYRKAMVN